MFIATLIANDLDEGRNVQLAEDWLSSKADCRIVESRLIEVGNAADIRFEGDPVRARQVLESVPFSPGIDIVVQPEAHRRKKLIVADMDSTMITIECIDELAAYAGIKPQIAEVTERAMRGELDFEAALDARVALLKGLSSDAIERCHAERVTLMPGARTLVRTMAAHGARAVLVSGGFTVFADRVAEAIGFHRALSNTLHIEDGALVGTVARPIVGAQTKLETLIAERDALGLAAEEVLAVGDGANDIPMIQAAGLGVAYHAKPKTAAAAHARIDHNDLTALLYAQGYARADWVA
ncbi:MAG: phosphoserine phosphatase SerB [Sphingomonadaceae bacterium]|nr:phosphoserine phosphatase SerB [Sphingomonadaceae bacterium]